MVVGFRILTVCEGNVHRSALAQVLLNRWAQWYLPPATARRITVYSAGLHAAVGEAMGSRECAVAEMLGAGSTSHRAVALTDVMITSADLVLTATAQQRDQVIGRQPTAMRRTFAIREAGRAAAAVPGHRLPQSVKDMVDRVALLGAHLSEGDDDIIDPHRRDNATFARAIAEEVPALAQVAQLLMGMPLADLAEYRAVAGDTAAISAAAAQSDVRARS